MSKEYWFLTVYVYRYEKYMIVSWKGCISEYSMKYGLNEPIIHSHRINESQYNELKDKGY